MSNKNPIARCRNVPLKLLVRDVLETFPKTIQTIIIVYDYPQELDGKILFLKTPYAVVSKHREINLILIRKYLSLCCIALIVPEGTMLLGTGGVINSLTQI